MSQSENGNTRRGIRSRVCITCGEVFSYEVGRGRDRVQCSKKCRVGSKVIQRAKWIQENDPRCERNCGRRPRPGCKRGVCEACYSYERRTGEVGPAPPKSGRYVTKAGYILITKPDHKLAASSSGMAYEHRMVLLEAIGDPPHPCFWCEQIIHDWESLIVDHLDEDKGNNDPSNLVPTCNSCNRMRGATLPFLARIVPSKWDKFIELIQSHHNSKSRGERRW